VNGINRDERINSGSVMVGSRRRRQVGNQSGSKILSKAQVNVVRTMICITVGFTICWTPAYFNFLFRSVRVSWNNQSSFQLGLYFVSKQTFPI